MENRDYVIFDRKIYDALKAQNLVRKKSLSSFSRYANTLSTARNKCFAEAESAV